jgi:hypothetical protein
MQKNTAQISVEYDQIISGSGANTALTSDPELQAGLAAIGQPTKPVGDVAKFSFNLVSSKPGCLEWQYVLGSTEYQYASPDDYSKYCDVFVMSVKGPTDSVGILLSVLPGTTHPVAISTVNNMTNTDYFIGTRPPASGTEPFVAPVNGLTTLLRTKSYTIQANVAYTIQLVLADGYDQYFDTMIWIKSGSLQVSGELLALPSSFMNC